MSTKTFTRKFDQAQLNDNAPQGVNSARHIPYNGIDADGFGLFRHELAGRLHGARRHAEGVEARMAANGGGVSGRRRGHPLTGIILCDLERLIAYRRAARNLDQVAPGQYVRAAVAHLVRRAGTRGKVPAAVVREWIEKHLPEFDGKPVLTTPPLKVDKIAEALAIRQDEVDANVLQTLVSVDRPPEVRAREARERDRAYSEGRRRAAGAKPQGSRTRTRDIARIAEAHGVSARTMQTRIKRGQVDFDTELAALADCKKASGTEIDSTFLLPTDFCKAPAEPAPAALAGKASSSDAGRRAA